MSGLLCVTSGLVTRPRVHELPTSGQRVLLWWRKRRLVCGEADRPWLCSPRRWPRFLAIAGANRVVAEVAAAFGVAWRTVHTALVAAAARWLHLEQTGA